MRRFRIRCTRHSAGSLPRALRQTSLLMQRLQRERALRTRRARALPYPAPAGKGAAIPGGIHLPRPSSARFPQVNGRLDCAPSKLARQQRHKRENETAAASDPCRNKRFLISKRTNTPGRRIRKFAQTSNRSFVRSAAKMNGSSPLTGQKKRLFAPRPPFARNTVQIVHPAPQKTRRIARYVPQGPKRAILRNSHPAADIRPASRQRSTCAKRSSSLMRQLLHGVEWPLIGLRPAHRGPCPWPNAHRAPGAARAQALPHPGRRAWCAPP